MHIHNDPTKRRTGESGSEHHGWEMRYSAAGDDPQRAALVDAIWARLKAAADERRKQSED